MLLIFTVWRYHVYALKLTSLVFHWSLHNKLFFSIVIIIIIIVIIIIIIIIIIIHNYFIFNITSGTVLIKVIYNLIYPVVSYD